MSKAEDYELDASMITSRTMPYEERLVTKLFMGSEDTPEKRPMIEELIRQYEWTNANHTIFCEDDFKHLIDNPIPNYYCPQAIGFMKKQYAFDYITLDNLSEEVCLQSEKFARRVAMCVPSELDGVLKRLKDKSMIFKAVKRDMNYNRFRKLMKKKVK